MGYVYATSECLSCKQLFSYNPLRVPSLRVNAQGQPDPNGTREPVCRGCMDRANLKRKEMGLEPHPIHPDAYEPVDEHELP